MGEYEREFAQQRHNPLTKPAFDDSADLASVLGASGVYSGPHNRGKHHRHVARSTHHHADHSSNAEVGGTLALVQQSAGRDEPRIQHNASETTGEGVSHTFDPDDPRTLRSRPDIDPRWNRNARVRTHEGPVDEIDAHLAASPERGASESSPLASPSSDPWFGKLAQDVNMPAGGPDNWFRATTGQEAISSLLESAGPIDGEYGGGADGFGGSGGSTATPSSTEGAAGQKKGGPSRPMVSQEDAMSDMNTMLPMVTVGSLMMGAGGPGVYDPSGAGMSPDPYGQMTPETDRCFTLEETWLRQCSSPPQMYLELGVTVIPLSTQQRKAMELQGSQDGNDNNQRVERQDIRAMMFREALAQHRESAAKDGANTPSSFLETEQQTADQPAMQPPPLPFRARTFSRDGGSMGGVLGSEGLRLGPVPDTDYSVPTVGTPDPASLPSFMHNRPGSVAGASPSESLSPSQNKPMLIASEHGGTAPSAPKFDMDASVNRMLLDMKEASKVQVGGTDITAIGSYMNQAVAGMMSSGNAMNGVPNPNKVGNLPARPDYYDPNGPDGAEPNELQVSGPEKCTRMLNNWLYKCALSPM